MLYPINHIRINEKEEIEFKLLTDEIANTAAMMYISHIIFAAYTMLFYEDLALYSALYDEDESIRDHAVRSGVLPSSYRGSEEDTIKLLRTTAEDIVSHDFVMPSFMEQRVIYGLIEHAKETHNILRDDILSPEETLSEKIINPIRKGLKEHPEDWAVGCDTYAEALSSFCAYITDPNNYKNIFFDDYDFLFMDKFDLEEDDIASWPFARMFNMMAETDEERALRESVNANVDRKYAQEMIKRRWTEETKSQSGFLNSMPMNLDQRLSLTPTTHLINMLIDIKNDEVDTFRWVNGIWARDLEFLTERKKDI